MGLFNAFQLPPEPCTDPVPWLEREIGHFYAPQLIQCRVCHKLKKADTRLFRAARTSDVLRTTCRACELKTQYGRTLNKRAQMIQQDPSLPAPFKQRMVRMLPDEVRLSKVERLKAYGSAALKREFRTQWRAVSRMISARRDILLRLLAANRKAGSEGHAGGRLHQLRTDAPICASYISELLALYTDIGKRIRNTQSWGKVVDWHMPPKHWQDAVKKLAEHEPGSSHYLFICESMSPWEFTTPDDRAQLERYDMLKLEEGDFTRFTWVSIISRGQGTLMRRMYPATPMPGMPPISRLTPDWLRAYNGYPAPEPETDREPTKQEVLEKRETEMREKRWQTLSDVIREREEREEARKLSAEERFNQAETRHAVAIAQQALDEQRQKELDKLGWENKHAWLDKPRA